MTPALTTIQRLHRALAADPDLTVMPRRIGATKRKGYHLAKGGQYVEAQGLGLVRQQIVHRLRSHGYVDEWLDVVNGRTLQGFRITEKGVKEAPAVTTAAEVPR